jgi:hypothetical protein
MEALLGLPSWLGWCSWMGQRWSMDLLVFDGFLVDVTVISMVEDDVRSAVAKMVAWQLGVHLRSPPWWRA